MKPIRLIKLSILTLLYLVVSTSHLYASDCFSDTNRFIYQDQKTAPKFKSERRIFVKYLSMEDVDGYSLTEIDHLFAAVRAKNLNPDDLLFRGFDGENTKFLLTYGNDQKRETLWAVDKEEFIRNIDESLNSPFDVIKDYSTEAIAVYDKSKMERANFPYEYRFLNPDNKRKALLGVFIFQYKK